MISLEFSDARSSAIPTPTWQYFVMKIINTYRSPDKVTIGNLSCKQVLNFFTSKYCRKNNLAGPWKFPLVQKSMIEAAKPVVACSDSKVAGFAPFPEAMIFLLLPRPRPRRSLHGSCTAFPRVTMISRPGRPPPQIPSYSARISAHALLVFSPYKIWRRIGSLQFPSTDLVQRY